MKNSNIDFANLEKSLNYLHVKELRDYCAKLFLSIKGKKTTLIFRIIHFVKTGEKIEVLPYPAISCAKKKLLAALIPESLMLKGLYKNDLKTRLFFKEIIGSHFHFTAFGIDWLEECWMQGLPPTYQEFADMWQKEYLFRKENGSTPKEEWAYINFVKQYLKNNIAAGSKEILQQWNIERHKHKNWVDKFFAENIWQTS